MKEPRQIQTPVVAESASLELPPARPTDRLPVLPGAGPFGRVIVVPKLVADAGDRAARRFANFFGSIENDNTRAAYSRACALFTRPEWRTPKRRPSSAPRAGALAS